MGRKKKSDGDAEVINFDEAKDALKRQLDANSQDLDLSLFDDDTILNRMNANHAFIKSLGGKPACTLMTYNEAVGKQTLEFVTPDSIQTIYSNEIVAVDKSKMEVGKWWIRHSERRTYDTVIFDPAKPVEYNNCLNLWEGFAVQPTKGSWQGTLRHIYKILCNSQPDKFRYFIRWLAWCVQFPALQAEVCCIFKGKEGAGKGFIFTQFVELFGAHGFTLANRELLTGKHNGHLQKICFLFADEAYYPGDKEAEGVLKQLITQPQISYRAMYREAIMGVNRLHIGMSTNNDWVIPAGGDARRYFINAVDNRYAKGACSDAVRRAYFAKLWGEMANGGRAAMLYDLSNMDLKGWHPRDAIPDTEEMENQKILNLSLLEGAVLSLLDDGIFPGEEKNGRYELTATYYNTWLETIEPRLSRFTSNKKTEIIRLLGATKRKTVGKIVWGFPDLPTMRKNFDDNFVRQKWDLTEKWAFGKINF